MTSENNFNIRVYGLCIQNGQILVSDEYRMDMYMTKFPGGGLEYGEGPVDCLKRECREEMELDIEVMEHFYTTDFFQPANFFVKTQLISIYYRFQLPENHNLSTSTKKFDFTKTENGAQSFRWIPLKKLTSEELTFPIDKKAVEILLEQTKEKTSAGLS